jgi:hypothetical protein
MTPGENRQGQEAEPNLGILATVAWLWPPRSVMRVKRNCDGCRQIRGLESVMRTWSRRKCPDAQAGVQRFCHQTAVPWAYHCDQFDQWMFARYWPPSPQPSRT